MVDGMNHSPSSNQRRWSVAVGRGKRLRVPKTAELVADQLRSQIVRREIAEGAALPPETELTGRFGVSRSIIREAFRILEAESLLTVTRGARGGARVQLPDRGVAGRYSGLLLQTQGTTLDDVFSARLVIEPAAAALAAEHHLNDDLDVLRSAIDDEVAAEDDGQRFALMIVQFHEQLVLASGNKTLAVLHGTLVEIIRTTTMHLLGNWPSEEDRIRGRHDTIDTHRALVGLIARREAVQAREFWLAHMIGFRDRYRSYYGATTVVELLH